MKTISTDVLARWLDDGEDVLLVDVLPHESFRRHHIPGAVNVPGGTDDFAQRVKEHAGDADQRIVVYCTDVQCQASPKAAHELEQAGFRDVFDYEPGLAGYSAAGRKLIGAL